MKIPDRVLWYGLGCFTVLGWIIAAIYITYDILEYRIDFF